MKSIKVKQSTLFTFLPKSKSMNEKVVWGKVLALRPNRFARFTKNFLDDSRQFTFFLGHKSLKINDESGFAAGFSRQFTFIAHFSPGARRSLASVLMAFGLTTSSLLVMPLDIIKATANYQCCYVSPATGPESQEGRSMTRRKDKSLAGRILAGLRRAWRAVWR